MGGSQGANIFDNKLKNTLINLSKKNLIKIIQQTSEKNINYLSDFYKKILKVEYLALKKILQILFMRQIFVFQELVLLH